MKEQKNTNELAKEEVLNDDLPIEVDRRVPIDDKHKLVVAIVKHGYGYQVVKVATENGGKGAVILNGRGITKEKKRFFGIDIAAERDLVMMVVKEEFTYPVVKSIYAIADFKSTAKGIVFVLPIATIR